MRRVAVAIATIVALAFASTASATTSCGEVIGYHANVYLQQSGTTCHVAEALFESGVDVRRPRASFKIAPFTCWNYGVGVGSPTFNEGSWRRVVFCEGRRSSIRMTLVKPLARRCVREAGPIPGTEAENCGAAR